MTKLGKNGGSIPFGFPDKIGSKGQILSSDGEDLEFRFIESFAVGGVYINITGVNPATELGYGTWSAVGAGRTLIGYDSGDIDFDTAEETGGAKTHTHTSHTGTRKGGTTNPADMATGELTHNSPSHLPPYIVVHFWKRLT
jgi:hypothetical protein